MPQAIILAAGQTAANSTTVAILSGGSATFSIRSTTAGRAIPRNITLAIEHSLQGGVWRAKESLSAINDTIPIGAAGSWRVARGDITAFGTDVEVTADT